MRKDWSEILLQILLFAVLCISFAGAEDAPDWADVELNSRGFLETGEYVLEDPEGGHWMYVNKTLRIQITRTWETPDKIRTKDYNQEFRCFTAEIWCDTESGEGPMTLWAVPDKPGYTGRMKTVSGIEYTSCTM